jgi:hypothetical protein
MDLEDIFFGIVCRKVRILRKRRVGMKKSIFALVFSLMLIFGLGFYETSQAVIGIEGPFFDNQTGGDWRGVYGSCFFLLPDPVREEICDPNISFNCIEQPVGPNFYVTTKSEYRYNTCFGGLLSDQGRLDFSIFKINGTRTEAFAYDYENSFSGVPAVPGASQWIPCVSQFRHTTFDNDLFIHDPMGAELQLIDVIGDIEIAYYLTDESIVCRGQDFTISVNGVTKTGSASDFTPGTYVIFRITGLDGSPTTITFETLDGPDSITTCIPPTAGVNSIISGVFADGPACIPPQDGDQGCTPGYWKQDQHFGSWAMPPYPTGDSSPTGFPTLFFDVFEEVITIRIGDGTVTNPTLLQALMAKGGGINSLARHASAAMLNARSGAVAYPLNPAEIVGLVQEAIPDGDIEGVKDFLAGFNDVNNCPLGINSLPGNGGGGNPGGGGPSCSDYIEEVDCNAQDDCSWHSKKGICKGDK